MNVPKTASGKACKLCLARGSGAKCHIHMRTPTRKKASPKRSPKSGAPKKKSPRRSPSSDYDEINNLPSGKVSDEWETKNELEIRTLFENKTVLEVLGCFCPPHIGHYKLINDGIELLAKRGIKIDVLEIFPLGSDKLENTRHGTPVSHSIDTMKDFARVLAAKHGIKAVWVRSVIHLDLWWRSKIPGHTFYSLRAYEGMTKSEFNKEYPEAITLIRKDIPNAFHVYLWRAPGGSSATAFTKCLKNYTKDCLEYVPEDVYPNRREYVENIRQRYGKYLR